MSPHELLPLAPVAVTAVAGIAVLLAEAYGARRWGSTLTLLGLLLADAAVWVSTTGRFAPAASGGSYLLDGWAVYLHHLLIAIAAAAVLLSRSYLRACGTERGEHYALLLFALTGMLGLTASAELVSLFVALEILSVALYALVGIERDSLTRLEAALKYFVTGAFSSAFLLYGIAWLYAVTGSTVLVEIGQRLAHPDAASAPVMLAVGLILVGFAFKIASVPFHMWAPDVYDGAPTTVTVLMAAGVKAAAFGAMLRVFAHSFSAGPLAEVWQPAIAVLAVVTMVVGNLAALAQTSVKRMLAYSSVAHAGYMLVALTAPGPVAGEAVLFYLAGYGAASVGAFGALAAMTRAGREPAQLDDLAGLAQRSPALAAGIALCMISLTGIPVSGGFVGKFYLFSAAVGAGQVFLAIVGVLMSVVSAYYYLRVVVVMYMYEPAAERPSLAPTAKVALVAAVLAVLLLGIYPAPILGAARWAATFLRA